jgi:ABC-type uncharacterized transport system permease subunit
MITYISVFIGGVVAGYMGYRIGFKMGVLAAMSRMSAVIVQMKDVVQDIEQFQKQWTEDEL